MLPSIIGPGKGCSRRFGLLRFSEKHTVAPHFECTGGGPVFANWQSKVEETGFRYLQLNAMATWDFAVAGAD
jgi:hypothetical protein